MVIRSLSFPDIIIYIYIYMYVYTYVHNTPAKFTCISHYKHVLCIQLDYL